MALKAFLPSLDGLPDDIKKEYKPAGEKPEDGFILDVEDKTYKTKLDEFRTNNRELHNKVQALEAEHEKYKDIDPERARKALAELQKLEESEEGRLLKEGKFDEVFQRRTNTMKGDFERQINELRTSRGALENELKAKNERLSRLTIDTEAIKWVSKAGSLRQGSDIDVLNRARSTFSINEKGEVVPVNPYSKETTYGKDGEPITMEEWGQRLLQEAPHLFEGSQGGGANGGQKGAGQQKTDEKVELPNDPTTIGSNLEAIASGKKTVQAAPAA